MRGWESLGSRIRRSRRSKGWTQARLAAEIDSNKTQVERWENDRCEPKSSRIRALCHALDVTPNYLFAWEGMNDAV